MTEGKRKKYNLFMSSPATDNLLFKAPSHKTVITILDNFISVQFLTDDMKKVNKICF